MRKILAAAIMALLCVALAGPASASVIWSTVVPSKTDEVKWTSLTGNAYAQTDGTHARPAADLTPLNGFAASATITLKRYDGKSRTWANASSVTWGPSRTAGHPRGLGVDYQPNRRWRIVLAATSAAYPGQTYRLTKDWTS